ncbi:MAG: DUF1569 domain-containing protein [Pirellulaceae bacterium]
MTINSTKRTSRRILRFQSLDEVLADAEQLASIPTRGLGKWTLGQVLSHLALVYEKSIDGTTYRPGWLMRFLAKVVLGPLFLRRVLRKGMGAGIRPPARMFQEIAPPENVSTAEGLHALRRAIGRLKSESQRDYEQCFHLFTREEWDLFHVRHAELHLSFIVPANA